MSAVDIIAQHILRQISPSKKPLFVALQGPQGSGKSYLTALTHKLLSDPPHSLRVANVSLDDLYLSHDGLVDLATRHTDNPLWRGRGQPGTHDIPLAIQLLSALKGEDKKGQIELPIFDKSLYNGEGDRLAQGNLVQTPVDIVIMEGWCMGFYPISSATLDERWDGVWNKERVALGLSDAVIGSKSCLQDINAVLHSYLELWSFFDTFIQLHPCPSSDSPSLYSVVYKWRLEQEHDMKARNGGYGMTDEAVKLFIDRYIPGYVFFGDGVTDGYGMISPPWSGKGIRIWIDEGREVVGVNRL